MALLDQNGQLRNLNRRVGARRFRHCACGGSAGQRALDKSLEGVVSETLQIARRDQSCDERRMTIAIMAEMVCEATRQAAIEGVRSAASKAAERNAGMPDAVRAIADQLLARATLMQSEIDRFMAVSRRCRRASFDRSRYGADPTGAVAMNPSATRGRAPHEFMMAFAAGKRRTRCHGALWRQIMCS